MLLKLKIFYAFLAILGLFSCGGGYSPPDSLVPPIPDICFKQGIINASKGGNLTLDMEGCGSLKWSSFEFDPGAISEDSEFRLEPADEIIQDPGVKLNYPLKITLLSPSDTEISGDVYFNVPYVESILNENEWDIVDVSGFFKSDGTDTFVLPQSANEKDEKLKKIKSKVSAFGSYEPGVEINASMSVGELKEFNFSKSQSSLILNASGGEGFVLMLTGLPNGLVSMPIIADSGSSDFTVTVSEPAAAFTKALKEMPKETSTGKKFMSVDELLFEQFINRFLIRETKPRSIRPQLRIQYPYGYSEGETATGINIIDFSSVSQTLLKNQEAVIHKVGDHGIFMVHDPAVYALLTEDQKNSINSLSDYFDDVIYPRITSFFGTESDVDNNDRIVIMMTDTLTGTGYLGFFYSIDLFTNDGQSSYFGGTEDSNEADIIYSLIPSDPSEPPDERIHELLIKSIIAHEFQHLVNFNNKTLKKLVSLPGETIDPDMFNLSDVPLEETFLNEGLSHFAEDIAGLADVEAGIPHVLNHPNGAYGPYLKNNWRTSLIDGSGYVSFAVRGQNYLFVRYLYEQAGGATPVEGFPDYIDLGGMAFLKELISSDYYGTYAIDKIFKNYDADQRGFARAYMDWLVALYNDQLDNSINFDPKYNYLDPYFDEMAVNQTVGIDLSSTRELEDTGEDIVIEGPLTTVFPEGYGSLSSTVSNVGAAYLKYKLASSPSKDLLRFKILGEESANLKGFLFRTE